MSKTSDSTIPLLTPYNMGKFDLSHRSPLPPLLYLLKPQIPIALE
jgi:hypothetical protein